MRVAKPERRQASRKRLGIFGMGFGGERFLPRTAWRNAESTPTTAFALFTRTNVSPAPIALARPRVRPDCFRPASWTSRHTLMRETATRKAANMRLADAATARAPRLRRVCPLPSYSPRAMPKRVFDKSQDGCLRGLRPPVNQHFGSLKTNEKVCGTVACRRFARRGRDARAPVVHLANT